jgi:hypothetical protein
MIRDLIKVKDFTYSSWVPLLESTTNLIESDTLLQVILDDVKKHSPESLKHVAFVTKDMALVRTVAPKYLTETIKVHIVDPIMYISG